MNENVDIRRELFKKPNIENERGEFERVGEKFGIDSSVLMFLAQEGHMTRLNDGLLERIENTDAYDVKSGDWAMLQDMLSNPVSTHQRDWQSIHEALRSGSSLDAPIVIKFGDNYHLVSGNTRLMVARVMDVPLMVYVFEVDDNVTALPSLPATL